MNSKICDFSNIDVAIDTFKDNLSKHYPREIGMNPSIFQKPHTLKKKVFEAFIVDKNFEIFLDIKCS